MAEEHRTIDLDDGRIALVHRAGSWAPDAPALVMHYGTPHTGKHPDRIARLAADHGVHLVSLTRPGFPGVPRRLGRSVADSATDVVHVLDVLGIDRVATAGYSGGGPHALALAALLGERVSEVAVFASPAPFDGDETWFEGMKGGGLRPAAHGLEAREAHQRTAEFDPEGFTKADWNALDGVWSGIGEDAQAAGVSGSDAGEIDDDMAFVSDWGVDLRAVTAEVQLFHAPEDRIVPFHHAERLAKLIPGSTLHEVPDSGHVAVLEALPTWMGRLGSTPTRK